MKGFDFTTLALAADFLKPASGAVVLRSHQYAASFAGEALGVVVAVDRDDARQVAAERWGHLAEEIGVRYVATAVESFTLDDAGEADSLSME